VILPPRRPRPAAGVGIASQKPVFERISGPVLWAPTMAGAFDQTSAAAPMLVVPLGQEHDRLVRLLSCENGRHDGNEADGWRDAEWIYVRPACWRRIHGADGHDEAARLHRSAGTLRSQQGEGLQFRMGREVVGRPRVCAVRASAVLAA
jgi:hypothetical protein